MTTLEAKGVVPAVQAQVLHQLRDLVRELAPTATVMLYGSAARGTRTAESDYDILVLTEEPLTMAEQRRVRQAAFEFELDCGCVFSMMFYSGKEWDSPPLSGSPFHCNVERDALLL